MSKIIFKKITMARCVVAIALASVALLSMGEEATSAAASGSAAKPIPALLIANAERGMLLGIARAGDQVVAVGGNGVIVRSPDGQSWRQSKSPVDTAFNAVAFADATHGWAVGHDSVILGTSDGGVSWTIQNFQPDANAPIFSILALSAQKAIVVGAFGLLKTTDDAGATWHDVDAPAISSDKLHLNGIAKLNNGKFAVSGEHGLVGISADGIQWSRIATPYEGSFFGILPWKEKGAIAFGMRGNVYICDDVDAPVWKKIETATTSSFFGGESLVDGDVLLTGSDSTVLTVHADASASATQKISKDGNGDSSLTGSLTTPASRIIIGESGVTVSAKR